MNINNLNSNCLVNQAFSKSKKSVLKIKKNLTTDTFEKNVNMLKKGSKIIKKIGLGAASIILPGTGQFANGDIKKGFGFLITYLGTAVAPLSLGLFPAFVNLLVQLHAGADAMKHSK